MTSSRMEAIKMLLIGVAVNDYRPNTLQVAWIHLHQTQLICIVTFTYEYIKLHTWYRSKWLHYLQLKAQWLSSSAQASKNTIHSIRCGTVPYVCVCVPCVLKHVIYVCKLHLIWIWIKTMGLICSVTIRELKFDVLESAYYLPIEMHHQVLC